MKRDMSLIRRILFSIKGSDKESFDDIDPDIQSYHERLCGDAGYVDDYGNLTTSGREFVNYFESDEVWESTNKYILDKGFESAPLEIFREVYALKLKGLIVGVGND